MTNAAIKDNKSVLKTVFSLKLFQEKEHRSAQTVFSDEGRRYETGLDTKKRKLIKTFKIHNSDG